MSKSYSDFVEKAKALIVSNGKLKNEATSLDTSRNLLNQSSNSTHIALRKALLKLPDLVETLALPPPSVRISRADIVWIIL